MAKIKDMIEIAPASFKTSLLDVLMAMDTSKTKKYVPMMLKVLQNKSSETNNRVEEDYGRELHEYYGISNLPSSIDPKVAYTLLHMLGSDITKDFMNFMDSYEKGYFKGLDITTISSKKELSKLNSLTALNKIGKELAKQVQKDFEDEEWLVVRPFTYESSLKYGYGSKWCTSMESQPEHFFRYSNNGTLIYCLNKKTGDKVAAFYEVGEGLSFWNAEDNRIDSMFSGLPSHIVDVIRGIVTDNPVSNRLLSPEVWKSSNDLYGKERMKIREVVEDGSEPVFSDLPDQEVMSLTTDGIEFATDYDASWVFPRGNRFTPESEENFGDFSTDGIQ
jgi:proteasome lid subunit RPN8/RPN11